MVPLRSPHVTGSYYPRTAATRTSSSDSAERSPRPTFSPCFFTFSFTKLKSLISCNPRSRISGGELGLPLP